MTVDSDIVFCAGFFDADGCVSIKKSGNCLSFYNDNKEVLEKIRDVLSVDNNILPREKPKGGTSYTLTICKRKDVIRIAEQFLSCSLATVKRDRLIAALLCYPILDERMARKREERIAAMQMRALEKDRQRKEERRFREEQQAEEQARIDSFIKEHPELSSRAIAAQIGLSHVTIIKHRRCLGLKQYRQRGMSVNDKQFIINHPELSSRAVSAQIGFSHVTVCVFRKHNSARA